MAKWKDVSCYSKGDKEKLPKCFELYLGKEGIFSIIVYWNSVHPGWSWRFKPVMLKFTELGLSDYKDKDAAFSKAMDKTWKILKDAAKTVEL